MRLSAALFAVGALAAAGAGAWKVAEAATGWYEQATATQLRQALGAAGQDWASVATDGLKVTLVGAAPDETSRFRALEVARQIVAPPRITDTTTLHATAPLPPPPYALELLRNDADISLIGLVPDTGGRDVINSALGAGGLSEHVTDMLESASDPAPNGWREALGFGLSVLSELPRAKISVAPGQVTVIAVADSDPDRAELETRLKHAAPEGVALSLDISAPRPVIAPFAFDFTLRNGSGTLAACSAESPEAAASILASAHAAGLAGNADCAVGLGAPSPEWAAAVARGLDALRQLGGGHFSLSDITAELTAPDDAPPEKVSAVSTGLDAALPEVFQLTTTVPPHMEAKSDGALVYAPDFEATLAGDGSVHLSGPVKDAPSQAAILSFSAALFGHDQVKDAMVIDPALPEGWPGRVLAGVEALSALKEGKLEVTPQKVAVNGWGLDVNVADKVQALLAAKVGSEAVVDVSFNAAAAAALADAARPRPEICADQISAILEAGSINFTAGSADIVPESKGVISAIADVLRGCPGADFEIGGHTDSEGTADENLRLSEARAQAVLAALTAESLPLVHLTAHGFGAEDPLADNTTEAGRAQNRRIEFTLAAPDGGGDDLLESDEATTDATDEIAQGDDDAATECAKAINDALSAASIQFGAGSATIAPESKPVIATIGEALRGCPDARFEIGGYTDSQGSDEGNLRLSGERAQAVLAALRTADLPLPGLTARGYGEANPIADNNTSAGRAQNRRIAFAPIADAPAAVGGTGPTEGDAAGAAPTAESPDAACIGRIDAILASGGIQFDGGSSTITPASVPTIDEIAAALKTCPDVAMEIGGHTDSQGSEAGNRRLSQERAQAVLAALRARDLALPDVTAHGYGESDPVADNDTFAGRAKNRRIAFNLVTAEGSNGSE